MSNKPKLTPAEQQAWDDARATPGILLDADGNVIFDAEAEALGAVPFKTRAEIDAAEAEFQKKLAAHRREREKEREAEALKTLPKRDRAPWLRRKRRPE